MEACLISLSVILFSQYVLFLDGLNHNVTAREFLLLLFFFTIPSTFGRLTVLQHRWSLFVLHKKFLKTFEISFLCPRSSLNHWIYCKRWTMEKVEGGRADEYTRPASSDWSVPLMIIGRYHRSQWRTNIPDHSCDRLSPVYCWKIPRNSYLPPVNRYNK